LEHLLQEKRTPFFKKLIILPREKESGLDRVGLVIRTKTYKVIHFPNAEKGGGKQPVLKNLEKKEGYSPGRGKS